MAKGNPNGRVTIPDETIRAMRRMYAVDRKTMGAVHKAFAGQVSLQHTYDILARRVRKNVADEVVA